MPHVADQDFPVAHVETKATGPSPEAENISGVPESSALSVGFQENRLSAFSPFAET
jgi:hypothetical protein